MSRFLRSRPADQRGFTTVELAVAVGLLSLVMAVIYGAMISATRAVDGANQRLNNLSEARLVIDTATKDMRTATRLTASGSAFVTAKDNEVIFYGNLNPTLGPKKIRIYVDSNTQFVEEITDPDSTSVAPNYTYNLNSPRRRFVGRYVANPASAPIFTYLDAAGNTLSPTPLTAAQMLQVRSVGIRLMIRKSTVLKLAATTVVSQVRLPNLSYTAVVN
ncbi:MAG: PulJ/GspJ family protein [Acidimicrobiia bacterium]